MTNAGVHSTSLRLAGLLTTGLIASLVRADCNGDNCLRAIRASAFPTRLGTADCSSYLLVTVTPATTTITVTATATARQTTTQTDLSTLVDASTETTALATAFSTTFPPPPPVVLPRGAPQASVDSVRLLASLVDTGSLERRQVTVSPSAIPTYALAACSSNASRYISACSCIGITRTTTTAEAPRTTITVTETATATSTATTLATVTTKSTTTETIATTTSTWVYPTQTSFFLSVYGDKVAKTRVTAEHASGSDAFFLFQRAASTQRFFLDPITHRLYTYPAGSAQPYFAYFSFITPSTASFRSEALRLQPAAYIDALGGNYLGCAYAAPDGLGCTDPRSGAIVNFRADQEGSNVWIDEGGGVINNPAKLRVEF